MYEESRGAKDRDEDRHDREQGPTIQRRATRKIAPAATEAKLSARASQRTRSRRPRSRTRASPRSYGLEAFLSPVRQDGAIGDSKDTTELKRIESDRERRERERAEGEQTEAGTEVHDRRAEKHAYLKEKLAERERAERESD